MSALLLALASVLPAAAAERVFPFAQSLDMDAVRELTALPPGRLLAAVAQRGLRVLRVVTPQPAAPLNPRLAGLPEADAATLQAAAFQDSYEGRLVQGGGCQRDTILIRDTASDYTLLHEVVHAALRPLRAAEPDDCIEQRFASALHRLNLYQRRLFDDPYRLLDPRWRRDILTAQLDVARDLFDRIRFGQSQEAIVEKLLAQLIDARYHDAARKAQGRGYGAAMIDNAIDVFNAVHESSTFVVDVVRHLHAAIVGGELEALPEHRLDDEAVAATERGAREVEALLAPVRAELEALKRFYDEG
ncbi:MAG: hypothetical protein U1F56_11855 [Rubrivivax sp.]